MRTARRNAPVLAAILGCWLAVTLACWIVTRAAFAASVRRLLAVHFVARLADPAHEALWIWLRNSKMTAGVAACIALVALVRWISPAGRRAAPSGYRCGSRTRSSGCGRCCGPRSPGWRSARTARRSCGAFLPDGPVEVTAWALLLALYINARRGHDEWRQTVWGLVSVEVLLALAAILEAWGSGL